MEQDKEIVPGVWVHHRDCFSTTFPRRGWFYQIDPGYRERGVRFVPNDSGPICWAGEQIVLLDSRTWCETPDSDDAPQPIPLNNGATHAAYIVPGMYAVGPYHAHYLMIGEDARSTRVSTGQVRTHQEGIRIECTLPDVAPRSAAEALVEAFEEDIRMFRESGVLHSTNGTMKP